MDDGPWIDVVFTLLVYDGSIVAGWDLVGGIPAQRCSRGLWHGARA